MTRKLWEIYASNKSKYLNGRVMEDEHLARILVDDICDCNMRVIASVYPYDFGGFPPTNAGVRLPPLQW
jgi:hypothetical protein